MKLNKQILSLLLAAVIVLTFAPTAILAGAKTPKTKTVTVRAVEDHFTSNSHDEEWSFTYSDDYFTKSGYTFRQDLACMTLGLAMASFTSRDAINEGDHSKENQNFIALMKQIGFKNPQSNADMKKPTAKDTIGVSCAYKKRADGSTLIAMGIRGDVYRSEWGGNLLVGATGDHANWSQCRDKALKYLKQYIKANRITGRIKLWVTGYSRSAAVSNLVAGKLDNGYDLGAATLARKDLYCYTYECPRGVQKSKVQDAKYDNIHNVLNENDIITYVVPKDWGFVRYGRDYIYPSKRSSGADYAELTANAQAKLKEIPNELFDIYFPDLYVGLFGMPNNQREYYDRLMTAVARGMVSSRKNYVNSGMQQVLSDAVNVWYSRLDKDISLGDALEGFLNKVQKNAGTVMTALVTGKGEAVLGQYFAEAMRAENITTYDWSEMKAALGIVAKGLARMAVKYPAETVTLLANILTLIAAHDVASNIVWIYTMPDGYLAKHAEYSWK